MSERIGDFLVRIGAMSQVQADEAMRVRESGGESRMFGEIAVELGYIDDEAIKKFEEYKASGA